MSKKQRKSRSYRGAGRPGLHRAQLNSLRGLMQQALELHRGGELDAAERGFREVLELAPGLAEALHSLGLIAHQRGESEKAAQLIRGAIQRDASVAVYFANLGLVLSQLGRLEEAAEGYGRALMREPGNPRWQGKRADLLRRLGRLDEALEAYDALLAQSPQDAAAINNRAATLSALGRVRDALSVYDSALAHDPDDAVLHNNRGEALRALGRVDDALDAYARALRLSPGYAEAYSNQLFTLHCRCEGAGDEILEAARAFGRAFDRPLDAASGVDAWPNAALPDRPLRVGYVSGDLRRHPVGYFLEAVLAQQQRSSGLEVICFPTRIRSDDLTQRLKGLAEGWYPLVGLDDEAAAALVRDLRVDILVDLSGHTGHNRLPLFARRAAPIQVTWLGYFGTTGLSAMDFILADRFVVPEGEEWQYAEQVWRLPNSYLCFTPPDEPVAISRPPGRAADAVAGDHPACHSLRHRPGELAGEPSAPSSMDDRLMLASFNKLEKLTPRTVALWSQVLQRLPEARLVIQDKQLWDKEVCEGLLSQFVEQGIATERIRLQGQMPRADYLAAYNQVDIALSPIPFSGGTTTAEALWMGVPVVALRGGTWAGRISESILSSVGLPELVAANEDAYVELVVALAEDAKRRAALRAQLRERMLASPLCDAEGFARDLEVAFRGMWQQWCAGDMPSDVSPSAAASAVFGADQPFTWDAMIDGFRALGGIAENVEQREGRYGLGLFAIDPEQPVRIHVPEHLLIPAEDVQCKGGDLIIRPEAPVPDDVRRWFALFQRHFSWGASGRQSVETFERGLRDLPEPLKQVLRGTGRFPQKRHQGDWDDVVLQMFLRTRQFNYRGKNVTLSVLELINHEPASQGFQVQHGIQVAGRFPEEVTVRDLRGDTLGMFLTYGFVSPEPFVFSQPMKVRQASGAWVDLGGDTGGAFQKGKAIAPRAIRDGDGLRLPYVLLGAERDPALPRTLFRKALADGSGAGCSTDEADALFDRIRFANQHLLCRILQAAEGVDQPVAALLRQAVVLQLKTMAFAYGAR